MSAFNKDIILDEEAFNTAVREFSELSAQLRQLRNEIEETIEGLKKGFNTPAGAKFISSCEKNLFTPLDKQKAVIDHISGTLTECREQYRSVFREYDELVSLINK